MEGTEWELKESGRTTRYIIKNGVAVRTYSSGCTYGVGDAWGWATKWIIDNDDSSAHAPESRKEITTKPCLGGE